MQQVISGAMLALKLVSAYFLIVALFALKKPKPIPRANPKTRFACVIADIRFCPLFPQVFHVLGWHTPAAHSSSCQGGLPFGSGTCAASESHLHLL